jgi:hypothetical protein
MSKEVKLYYLHMQRKVEKMKHSKKILAPIIALTMVLSIGYSAVKVSAAEPDIEISGNSSYTSMSMSEYEIQAPNFQLSPSTIAELQAAYQEFLAYAESLNVPVHITLQDYISSYSPIQYSSVAEYEAAFESLLVPMPQPSMSTYSSSSSGSSAWYYNTGITLPANANPVYNSNLYSLVQTGDIIYEANGGFGITGHCAIVEGKYYNAAKDVNYIRVIEAIDVGVVRSVLDDTRAVDRQSFVYRVNGATTSVKLAALNFCIGELGSTYSLDFAKDYTSSETDWYCSELVWAGYKIQGYDIEVDSNGEPGVTPRDITTYSSHVTQIYSPPSD